MSAMAPGSTRSFRADIQALRAVAVIGVILFHFWPQRLTGGYVGVDVFFVISGYLITSHLMAEITRTGTVSVLSFWARRIRRLLPAALLVIAVTGLATLVWIPRTFWKQYAVEAIASATYWQNWRLAADSVDYLGAENAASAFQHYWSLSVEEQFYFVWPLLLVAVLLLGRKLRAVSTRTLIGTALGGVFVLSLAWSAWAVAAGDPSAYFATQSRAWEFSLGGLVALAPTLHADGPRAARALLAFGGWAAIASTFVFYTSQTPFPGLPALLPVLGAAAVIVASDNTTYSWLTGSRVAQFLGDNSYSLYLWHWPAIIIAPFALGRDVGWREKLFLLAVVIVASFASRKYVEDPVRFSSALTVSRRRVFLGAAATSGAIVALGITVVVLADRGADQSERDADALLADATLCLGAAAVLEDPGTCDNSSLGEILLPAPGTLKDDTGGAYGCYEFDPKEAFSTCTYGSTSPTAVRVAITGDSHGASLVPGLRPLLENANWRLDVFVSRGCEWSETSAEDSCHTYRTEVNKRLFSGDYDYILVAERRSAEIAAGDPNPRVESLATVWEEAIEAGSTVVAIADDPSVAEEALLCLESASNYQSSTQCAFSADRAWAFSDPVREASRMFDSGVILVDLADAYCQDGRCPMVVGHVGVYRDLHHITATFSKTIGPYIVDAVTEHEASQGEG